MNNTPSISADPKREPGFTWRFLAPRYWGIWCLIGVLRTLMILPRTWIMALGAWVGDQYRNRNRKRRRIVEVNIELCFPELSKTERDKMCVEHFRAYGRSLVDMGFALWGSARLIRKHVSIEGFEAHQALLEKEKVLLIAWHQTTLEVTASMMCLTGSSVAMMNVMKNPLMTWLFRRARSRFNYVDMVYRDQGLRPLLKGLKKIGQCVIIPDEDFGGRGANTVFLPFFGVDRATLVMPAKLARSAGAKVVTCGTRLIAETGKYVCTFSPPLELDPGADDATHMGMINIAMEQLIKQAPEQYLWTFRWFSSRPGDAPSPYDPVPGK